MLKDTLKKFGYPNSLIKEYDHWLLLLRSEQVTLGAMILICKEDVNQFHAISEEAMQEMSIITKEIELCIQAELKAEKINYLMLMMVDPEVHFHVIPRYSQSVDFENFNYTDGSWPGAIDLASHKNTISDEQKILVRDYLRGLLQTNPGTKRYNRMYTSGCFDLLHYGHLNILKRSKELCNHLIVGVSTDELIMASKGRKPVIPYEERFRIISSVKYVDEVIPQVNKNKQSVVDEYNIDAISVGSDWKGKYPPVTCDMVYFDYTPNVSSTILKKALNLLENSDDQ
ncbi:adenylyltransferase/cytidyltransferase family protein [Carboxylicivirga sp. A043]|uniref:adenylyltransferase/cytidyltransferase family protein n=1 Tax=Carboxylicivirga litoralis TaxID=2816963 RepID=UPI0021CB6A0D|nr:adenylyltransferase/cytidyltransferase family protein [Carboxylicivirga sp. A043]MCU4156460.1 adenylyltransferase/cytidyltransferase family protein [Carboxylicivirga sp. A043]